MNVKEIIEKKMQAKKITYYKLSQATGIPSSALSAWKNGRTGLSEKRINEIFLFLGVKVR
jgi:transcriptional regulator with XRE-family HTH domain